MTTDPLALDARKKLYERIRKHPGLHYRELERQSELEKGTFEYHLAYLEDAELVMGVPEGGFTRYFVTKARLSPSDKRIIGFLRQELPRGILLFIVMHPGTDQGKVAQRFTVSRPTISYHMKRFEGAGIVTSERSGRKKVYHVRDPDRMVELLIQYRPSFVDVLVDALIEVWYRTSV